MHYVKCPTCQAEVAIPADAVGPDRTDLFNTTYCYDCGSSFDYDDDEVVTEAAWRDVANWGQTSWSGMETCNDRG